METYKPRIFIKNNNIMLILCRDEYENLDDMNIVAANMGSVAFFDPEIVIVPEIFLPPLISNFCI